MRAVVDNRSLARLNGARPERASAVSWALGCSLASLAGILLAERVGLEVVTLTFLVVNAYAAAVVGRLTSLPLTFLGAIILGLLQSYAQGYISANPEWLPDGIDITTPLRLAIPVILLFVTLLIMPNAPLRTHGLQRSRESVPKPDRGGDRSSASRCSSAASPSCRACSMPATRSAGAGASASPSSCCRSCRSPVTAGRSRWRP